MNKILRQSLNIGLAVLVVLSALVPGMTVFADDGTGEVAIGDVTDPGILPDSGFYFMKSWGRNLQMMFAGSDTEKARLMLKYTNEDALALQKMYELGKYDVGNRHAEQYVLQLQNTVQTMEQVRTRQGENASEELVNKLEQNYLRQQEVLLSALEKAPFEAQDGLLNAIENSNKHVAAMVMAQNGEQALQQYEEQVSQQTNNMGQATKIKVQQKLQSTHGQASQSSGQGVMTQNQTQTQAQTQSQSQTQTSTQTTQQSGQQNGQQNTQNQGAGQSNAGSGGGSGNQKQGK